MIEVQEIRDIDELAGYRLAWNSWLADTPRATFVNTFDWLENYWRHFGAEQQLRVLVVRSAGAPVGIVPLCVRTERHGLGTPRVLTYPLDGWGSWYGPIGSNPAVTMLAAMQHIRRVRRDWDMIDLPSTAPPSRDGGRVGRSMRIVGLLSEQRPHQIDFARRFRRRLGQLLGQQVAAKCGMRCGACCGAFSNNDDVEYIRHRPAPAREGDGDPRWDLYAMCQQVALASWQADSTTGTTLTHERVRHFLRDAHAIAARNGNGRRESAVGRRSAGGVCLQLSLHGRLTGRARRLRCVARHRRVWAPRSCCGRSRTAASGATCRSILGRARRSSSGGCGRDAEASYRMTYAPLAFVAVAGGAAFAVGDAAIAAADADRRKAATA